MAGHKTWSIGEEVVNTDFNPIIADQIVAQYASAAARNAGWVGPPEGAVTYLRDVDQLQVFNGSVWVATTPVTAFNATSDTRTGATFGDLTGGAGPAVSVLTGTTALVLIQCEFNNSGGADVVAVGVAVSGATTKAATDQDSVKFLGPIGAQFAGSAAVVLTGLTAGSNTFTLKYRAATGTITALNRRVTVIGIP